MCRDERQQCPWCHWSRHIHWEWCEAYLADLKRGIMALQEPLPKPDNCPNRFSVVTLELGILTCPIEECPTTELEPARLAEIAEELRQLRAEMAAEKARVEEIKRDFADKYFQRRPVVRPRKESDLSRGLEQLAWLTSRRECYLDEHGECAVVDSEDEESLQYSEHTPILTTRTTKA
ncbi:hypothetical protein B0I35DRAFT_477799 [Stachybotrys elegans]|uniref:Uncharacterized protein n=1 Tax=Stachybotrys elegans TaxID=80388 RepID=A0A8K0T004_9HYPO|nr:hypothetical protein B0I35DRAFT_477799 [Stachybotrys elegans]